LRCGSKQTNKDGAKKAEGTNDYESYPSTKTRRKQHSRRQCVSPVQQCHDSGKTNLSFTIDTGKGPVSFSDLPPTTRTPAASWTTGNRVQQRQQGERFSNAFANKYLQPTTSINPDNPTATTQHTNLSIMTLTTPATHHHMQTTQYNTVKGT
jgi:hypothetical protein